MSTHIFAADRDTNFDHQDCTEGYVRLIYQTSQDNTPRDIDQAILSIGLNEDVQRIGPYPAKLGAHWSDQPHGRAGWYVIVGPVPEADLPADMREYFAIKTDLCD